MNTAKIEKLYPYTKEWVGYKLIYAEICNGVKAGLLLSKLMQWWEQTNYTAFYMSSKNLQFYTRMSITEIKKALKDLKTLGFITTRTKGSPPTNYFIMNVGKIYEQIVDHDVHDGKYTRGPHPGDH